MTGSVIPGNLPAHTDRVPEQRHTTIGTDSGPDDVSSRSHTTTTRGSVSAAPSSFLETGNSERQLPRAPKNWPPEPAQPRRGFRCQPGVSTSGLLAVESRRVQSL